MAERFTIFIQNEPRVAGEGLDKPAAGTGDLGRFVPLSVFIEPDELDSCLFFVQK